jgi:hypothetical protein
MYKQKLTLLERITLQQIIPQRGDYIDSIVAENLAQKLQLTQPELDNYGVFPLPGNRIGWNEAGTKAIFDIELTEREYTMVKLALETAVAGKAMPFELRPVYEAICKPELPADLKPTKKGGK